MFPASVKKLRPAFVGGAVGSVGASRRRWPPCRTSLRRSRKIPGFAVGGGAWRQRDWGRLRVGVEKVGFQVLSVYHLQNCPNNSPAPSWLPEAQRLRDVRPKAGESGNNLPIQSALRMSIILRSWGAFWIFGPAHPRAQSLRFRQWFGQWRLYDLPTSTAATYRFATSLMVC